MAKKSQKEIFTQILQELEIKSMTANEVAKALDSNWDTIKAKLDVLKGLGYVTLTQENDSQKTKYKIKQQKRMSTKKTWFNFPISSEQRTSTLQYFNETKLAFNELGITNPGSVKVNKITIDLAKTNEEEKIPYGWYLYGPICILSYNSLKEEDFAGIPRNKELHKQAIQKIKEYGENSNSSEFRFKFYKNFNNQLYLTKYNIEKNIDFGITDDSKHELLLCLSKLIFHLPKDIGEKETYKLFEKIADLLQIFVSLSSQVITRNTPEKVNKNLKNEISEAFDKVWELLTTFLFFNDISKTVLGTDILDSFAEKYYQNLKNNAEIALEELSKINENEIVTPNPAIARFSGISN